MDIGEICLKYGDDIKRLVGEHGPVWAAYELGLTVNDVRLATSRLKCFRRENGDVPPEMIEELKREFELCKSVSNMARDWGCSPQFIRTVLNDAGVDTNVGRGNGVGNAMDLARRLIDTRVPFVDVVEQTGLTMAGVEFAARMRD